MSKEKIVRIKCHKWNLTGLVEFNDDVAIESPLEISISGAPNLSSEAISITMRTPGNDGELALGFLYGEGLFSSLSSSELSKLEYEVLPDENRVLLYLPHSLELDTEYLARNFYTTSSCGVCGKSSINALLLTVPPQKPKGENFVRPDVLNSLPVQMREKQSGFEATGGTHASALFNKKGELMHFAEDVGRHNAMDKAIGSAILSGNINDVEMACFSGRTSFELIQKSAMAGINIVVCKGAPSSLAIDLAKSFDMLLIGFHREHEFNVYSGHDSIIIDKD